MTFQEALEIMKRGGEATRGGRTFRIGRGLEEVTDPKNVKRGRLTEEDGDATDWVDANAAAVVETEPPAAVDPSSVDDVLTEKEEPEEPNG
jgi:hypothetical protein